MHIKRVAVALMVLAGCRSWRFVTVLFSVRFVDWSGRKPFLRDFYRIKEGMTESQVDQIMSGYMKGYYGGPPASLREYKPQFDEQGRIITG
jgi:hypothetical protein